ESRRFVNLQVSRAFCIGRLNGVESLSERRQTRLCGVDRETRFQAGGDIERVVSWLRQIVQSFGVGERGAEVRVDAERQPDIGCDERAHPAKSIWSDADYGVRLAIDLEIAPDKIRATAHPLPKRITGHNHRHVRVRAAFVAAVKPAAQWLHAHEREKIL